MDEGGNSKLNAFFDEYNISDLDIKTKYNTVAASYYRRMLEAKATGQEFLELQPSLAEGRSVPDLRRLDTDVSV